MDKELTIKLYQTIIDNDKPRVFENWHCSSLAECPRTQYFKRLGIEPLPQNRPSAAIMLRWQAGHNMETAIREHLKSLYPDLISNKRYVSKRYDLSGEFDNLAITDKTLIEIKTVHDYAFIQRDGETYLKEQDGLMPNGNKKWKAKLTPYLHHEIQNHAYVLLLEEKEIFIERIKYIYISLSGRIVVYDTVVQKDLLTNVKERLKVLNTAWQKKQPPMCICGAHDHPLYEPVMRYCPYRTEDGCCDLRLTETKNA